MSYFACCRCLFPSLIASFSPIHEEQLIRRFIRTFILIHSHSYLCVWVCVNCVFLFLLSKPKVCNITYPVRCCLSTLPCRMHSTLKDKPRIWHHDVVEGMK
ncbi:hypothetical protein K474DRAFT_1422937 [Panus rudis PR-1116 ss-1]|nr:hypothetical protein K474DRAFT_1422937 [Panus rudis PR-1116 ss-1]